MDSATSFAEALEAASRHAIGFDFANLSPKQYELYEERRLIEQKEWVKLIEKRDEQVKAESLRLAAERARNKFANLTPRDLMTWDLLASCIIQAILVDKQNNESPLAKRLVEIYNSRLTGCDCHRCNNAGTEKESETEVIPAESKLIEALTPSAYTKAVYSSEFSFAIPDFDEDGNEHSRTITVPWTTIKEIMAAIKARAGLAKRDYTELTSEVLNKQRLEEARDKCHQTKQQSSAEQ